MNADFIRHAHRKAIWARLGELLVDKFISQDGPPKEQIVCEEVPYKDKDVTNEALLEVLEQIQQCEVDEQIEMRQFVMKRRRPLDGAAQGVGDGGQQPGGDQGGKHGGAGEQGSAAAGQGEVEAAGAPAGSDDAKPGVVAAGGAARGPARADGADR